MHHLLLFSSNHPTLFVCCILIFSTICRAKSVHPSPSLYRYVNHGKLSSYVGEFNSSFRRVDGLSGPTFGVYFVRDSSERNYTLAVGLGHPPRQVWSANRNNLVDDGATLTLKADGNLVLADSGGRVVWKTNTTNKGVVGIKLLGNGNLVLHDTKHNFLWQSFDFPVDVILPGQPMRAGRKILSRASAHSSRNGSYILNVRPIRVSMYYRGQRSKKLSIYYTLFDSDSKNKYKEIRFGVQDADDNYSRLTLDYLLENGEAGPPYMLTETKYNSTLSFLRLDYDGNLRVYSYYDKVLAGQWTTEFTLFTHNNASSGLRETECQLPKKCGDFGVCSEDQCVGCPSPPNWLLGGLLLGWSRNCKPPELEECSDGKGVWYYDVQGVEHFSSKYNSGMGHLNQSECELKCTQDCKCLGYFHHPERSRCWMAYDLNTLTKSEDSTHMGYIKISNSTK